jgi:BCCT family betaine/carnitine transporter
MFDNFIFPTFFSLFALFMLVLFFVTSSDSGSLVIDTITSGGKNNSPKIQRVIWAIIQGLLAIVILLAGGPDALLALQSGVISMALPFTFVLILAVFSLFYGILIEVNFLNTESKTVNNKEL